MPYFNNRYKGVRTEDHDTYMGYPSEFMHKPTQQKSAYFRGDSINLEDRKRLKKYLQETAVMRDINNVKKGLYEK